MLSTSETKVKRQKKQRQRLEGPETNDERQFQRKIVTKVDVMKVGDAGK
jgi:hypothetical protein